MRCEQARQLFDAYLDGELSGSLSTELGAHRLCCAQCRQELALLEVSGHVIGTDREPVELRGNFAERLLACMDPRPVRWAQRLRHGLFRRAGIAVPLAAAAVVVLAFLGVFDRRDTKVAGEKGIRIERTGSEASRSPVPSAVKRPTLELEMEQAAHDRDEFRNAGDAGLEEWIERTRKNIAAKRESGESLRQYLDLTILQWLDILNSAKDKAPGEKPFPGTDPGAPEVPPTTPDADQADH